MTNGTYINYIYQLQCVYIIICTFTCYLCVTFNLDKVRRYTCIFALYYISMSSGRQHFTRTFAEYRHRSITRIFKSDFLILR